MAISASTNGHRADAANSIYLAGKSRYGTGSFLFFDAQGSTDPLDNSSARGLFVDSSNRLSYWNGTTTVRLTGGGSGTTPTWEEIYAVDATFALTSATWTITQSAAAALLTLTKSNVGAGAVLVLNNSGTGNDITGTSSTWSITAAGVITNTGLILGDDQTLAFGATTDGVIQWVNASSYLDIAGNTNFDGNMTIEASHTLTIAGAGGADKFTITAGDAVMGDGSLSITDADNAESVTIINNTATTIGNASSAAVVQLESTSLTTGCLLNLQLTEGTLSGGKYLRCWDATAGAENWSVGEDGLTTILGGAGSNMLVITAGDVSMADGSITVADADNAATLSVTNNTATTATPFVFAGSGTFTGSTTTSFMTITPSGLTSGTALYLPLAAATTGKGIHVVAGALSTGSAVAIAQDGEALAAGELLTITNTESGTLTAKTGALTSITNSMTHTNNSNVTEDFDDLSISRAVIRNTGGADANATTSAGALLKLANTITATTGTITDTVNGLEIVMSSGGSGNAISITHAHATTGVALNIAASGATSTGSLSITNNALTTGTGLLVTSSGTIITTGELVSLVGNSATTCTGLLRISGTGLTDGWAIEATGGGANMTSSGGVVNVAMGAATDGSGVKIVSSGVYTGTVGLLAVTGNSATTGSIVTVTANGLTTGTALTLTSTGTIVTTGEMISVVANSATTCTGLIRASGTGLTDGFVAELTGGGANATSSGGVLNLAAGAATAGSALKITTSGVYTGTTGVVDINAASANTGIIVDVGAAGLTTGTILKLNAVEATLTTGKYIQCYDGAADDFSVAKYGATTIAGNAAGTAALTLNAGDATLTSGHLNLTAGFIKAGTQALSGPGAVDIVHLTTEVTTTGADALTIADGADGQLKIITMVVDGGEGTLTPANPASSYATIKFNDVSDSVILVFVNSAWHILANYGCTIA